MEWYSFLKYLPKVGERILIIHEWVSLKDEKSSSIKNYTIYECNYKSIKKDFYNKDDRSVVNFVNLKMVGGEKLFDHLEERKFYSKFIRWARLN